MVLLAAMVAAITLTFRGKKPGNKSISPTTQIKTDPKDRLKMVKFKQTQVIDEGKKDE